MKIQLDLYQLLFSVLVVIHRRGSFAQLTVDILKFDSNQQTLDDTPVFASYSFPTGFSNPLDWFTEPYANIPSDGGLAGVLYHPIPHNACTPILRSRQRDCASICTTKDTTSNSPLPAWRALSNDTLLNLSRIALVNDYHVCTGSKLRYIQATDFDGLITFAGDDENHNVNNRVYDNTAKSQVDVVGSQLPVVVVSKQFAETLLQNATYLCTTFSECQRQQIMAVVRIKGDSRRQGWIQAGIGIGLVVVVIGTPLITCVLVCICCAWCCTLSRSKKYHDDDKTYSCACLDKCKDCCVLLSEICTKSGSYEVHQLQHQVLGPDEESAQPLRAGIRSSSRREELLREREKSLHNLRQREVDCVANSNFRRTYETTSFNEREYTQDEKAKETSKTCTICLCELEVGEKVCALPSPCDDGHIFHTGCIEQWLETNSVCPMCRKFIALPNH